MIAYGGPRGDVGERETDFFFMVVKRRNLCQRSDYVLWIIPGFFMYFTKL